MVVKVRLEGLNIVHSRGRFYVYIRDTGEKLLSGFEGSRAELEKRMALSDFIALYNARRKRDLKHTYAEGTLGSLVQWFENDCPRYQQLAEATKKDYTAAFVYLTPEFDYPVTEITQADVYEIRDRCSKDKWPRFADKMVSALSSMFSEAVKRRKMGITQNPATGLDKAHRARPESNREWASEEVTAALEAAPTYVKTILYLARYAGLRGQTIASLPWKAYQDDKSYGKCFRVTVRKNGQMLWIPAARELQDHLSSLTKTSLLIATRSDGQPWEDERKMQTAISHFLRGLEADGKIGPGTTLHGLRVTYAADLKRNGADTAEVAAALGDRSERMGSHYTRHVENEAKVIRAFAGKQTPKKNGE